MRGRPKRAAVALFAVALLSAACNGNGTLNLPSPSTVPTTTPTSGIGNGVTITNPGSPPPTTSPGVTGNLKTGSASLTTAGDLALTETLTTLIGPTVFKPPPGGMDLRWSGGRSGKDLVTIGGLSFAGTRSTSPSMTLTLTVYTPGSAQPTNFASAHGECTVTFDTALQASVSGSFACHGLQSSPGQTVINANGTFQASG